MSILYTIAVRSMEAWWIKKYEMENFKVMNIAKPKITVEDLREKFNDIVVKQEQLSLDDII